MTNKELRDNGELYDANYDPELVRLMDECKDKCWEYNQIKPSDWPTKDAKLREIIRQRRFWCSRSGAFLVRLRREHHIRRIRTTSARASTTPGGTSWTASVPTTRIRRCTF